MPDRKTPVKKPTKRSARPPSTPTPTRVRKVARKPPAVGSARPTPAPAPVAPPPAIPAAPLYEQPFAAVPQADTSRTRDATGAVWSRAEVLRAGLFLVVFLAAQAAVSAVVGESVMARLFDTAVYGLIAAVTMALLGVVGWTTPGGVRIAVALLVAASVFGAMAVGGPLASLVFALFLLLLPLWTVIVVTGTGRFRWTPTQFVGATLLLTATWRPLYSSFPDLTSIQAGTSGVLPSYTVVQLYEIVTLKLFHESVFALAGIFLLFQRFPFLQKVPERGDAHAVFSALHGERRFPLWLTFGLGAFTFTIALFGSSIIAGILSGTTAGQGGTDDSRVFEQITPALVLLLSFAAGLGEELLFRAILLPAFERAFRATAPSFVAVPLAILVQAALFGIVHAGYGNWSHVLLPFAFGLLAGVAYRVWGFIPVVYAHAMIDVIAFGIDAAQTRAWVEYALGGLVWANLLFGVAAVVLVIVQWFQRRDHRRMSTPVEPLP